VRSVGCRPPAPKGSVAGDPYCFDKDIKFYSEKAESTPEEPVVEPVEQQKLPTQPKEQLAAIRDLLRTQSGEWTVKQIAAQFTGRTTQNKLAAITENLERLEWFGIVIPATRVGITYWQFAESTKAA
jgi:hypothetical protein